MPLPFSKAGSILDVTQTVLTAVTARWMALRHSAFVGMQIECSTACVSVWRILILVNGIDSDFAGSDAPGRKDTSALLASPLHSPLTPTGCPR
jgi:hypothetical protein